MRLEEILTKEKWTREDLVTLLSITDRDELKKLYEAAYKMKIEKVGNKVYFRGIVEFSNICIKNCDYCGIRKDNHSVERFTIEKDEILKSAKWAYDNKYGSMVLQSGERQDEEYIAFVEDVIKGIKEIGDGSLRITLSLGEQSEDTYRRWFSAGAERYLLRIESSTKELYNSIHPADHSFEERVECLKRLKKIGFQTGTGVMIGIPGQTEANLADDILFFEKMDIDMIGMGPYVVHRDTPVGKKALNTKEEKDRRFELGLKMIAVTRLYLKDVNIASTTALQALNPVGREMGLKAGANVIMPIITEGPNRKNYQLYDNKPCIDDNADECKTCLENRIKSVGDVIGYSEWGDSNHFKKRNKI